MEQNPKIPKIDGPKEPHLTTGEYPYPILQIVNSEPFLTYDTFAYQARTIPNNAFDNMEFSVDGTDYRGSFGDRTQDFLYARSKNPPIYPESDEIPSTKPPSHGIKFHISVDPHRIDEAWNIVLDVMAQYGVPAGKVDNPFNQRHPEEGREITLYAFKDYGRRFLDSEVPTDDRASWEEIISQITTLLAEKEIQPGVAAEGNSGGGGPERRIPNNNYVTWRNDNVEMFKVIAGISKNQGFYTTEDIEKIQHQLAQEQITMESMNIQCPYAQQERLSLDEHIHRRNNAHFMLQGTASWEAHKPISNSDSENLGEKEEVGENKRNKITISSSRQKKDIATDTPSINSGNILDDTSPSQNKTDQIWQTTKHKYTDKRRTPFLMTPKLSGASANVRKHNEIDEVHNRAGVTPSSTTEERSSQPADETIRDVTEAVLQKDAETAEEKAKNSGDNSNTYKPRTPFNTSIPKPHPKNS